jgi:hypothetical protein
LNNQLSPKLSLASGSFGSSAVHCVSARVERLLQWGAFNETLRTPMQFRNQTRVLQGHSRLERTASHLGSEVDDALEMPEQTEVQFAVPNGSR